MTPTPSAAPVRILVGDDQQDVLEALRLLLKGAGHRATTVDSPAALLAAARDHSFDLILMDLNYARDTTSGREGLDLLASLHAQSNVVPVVVMTAWGSIDLAVEAMRRGASDFIQKPWDNTRLLATIARQIGDVRRARSELEIARDVQQKLFPPNSPVLRGLTYAARCTPAREVGGDYYDFMQLDNERLGIVFADVSGKGVPAALLMANLQACFRSHAERAGESPAQMIRSINRLFFSSTSAEHFATAFFGIYEADRHRMRFVNCGHLPPVLARVDGSIERLEPTSTVLGAFAMWDCEESEVTLEPGDTVLLFSDGISEAESPAGDDFGEARLVSLISAFRADDPPMLVDKIQAAVEHFSCGAQDDDRTLVALRRVA